ncbi:protein kinase [Phytophthora infestans T30-4]|uniref:Protein kinase n=2 Tax=Phytophthora infestans TaxID=4787 RepID=D0N7J2_PHYIT|nr:protein kinase [Phytophthora infestans T30-4]EEY53541.1 protein kinase [Phytophthora infestans T30-4]KAF4140610.1 Protein tyrosine kinase [Phytophthora infestans]|eukprot:XP_002905159.1 protein kinase [Phytophthora infestans T30-4]
MIVLLVSYGSMSVLSAALIAYMRHNRHVALKGDTEASRKTLLPAFEPLLWILCIATGSYAMYFMIALIARFYAPSAGSVATEAQSAGRHFVMELALVFMLQKSVSMPALTRSIIITSFLACYALPFVWFTTINGQSESSTSNYWIVAIARLLISPLYIYVIIRPPARASKRTLREYCAFGIVYQVLELTYHTAFNSRNVHLGFVLIYIHVLWGSLCPLFVWRLLKADTEHWRGLGQRAVGLQALFRKGNIHERVSSQGLHVLIEMHRKYIIDFSVLHIKQRIGVGSTAVVYNGLLHSKTPVAIKVYTPSSVTEDTVAEFSHEAALCGALNHPNIVKFFGMCVSPPTICLVSELCVGSLDVVALALARRQLQPRRQQFLLNLGYLIDAARALAYLHSFSPAFVHRDIKPSNFLVDVEGNVKLTDFGESRSLPKANITWEVSSLNDTKSTAVVTTSASAGTTAATSSASNDVEHYQEYPESTPNMDTRAHGGRGIPLTPPGTPQAGSRTVPMLPPPSRKATPEMTVKGTVDYMAPEIINGRAGVASYGESADVYSLAITMWDILNPGAEKYPGTNNNHLRVLESVMAGARPELDNQLHAGLAELITNSWHVDARMRPSAQKIVVALERIQEEVCPVFALEMCEEMEHDSTLMKSGGTGSSARSFSGEQAARKMQDIEAVASVGEATRLGNMFMNAGFMHHIKHSQPFKSSEDMFYFDEDNINFCQPFVVLEGPTSTCRSGAGSNATRRPGSTLGAPLPSQLVQSPGWFKSLQRQHQPSDPTPPLATTSTLIAVKDSKSSEWDAHTASDSPHNQSDIAFVEAASNGTTEAEECACRKLGERPNIRKPASHRFRRKYRAIPEDNILTANLLQEEDLSSTQDRHLLDEFDAGPATILLGTQ